MNKINIVRVYTFCKLAYKNPDELLLDNKYIFLENKETDVQCYLFFDCKMRNIYVTFRGTSSGKDMAVDLNVKKVNFFYDTKVHKGFFDQYMSIRNILMGKLNIYKNDYNIITCGHSLGGALATLFAVDYKCDCITIGAPRVGNKEFCDVFNKYVKKSLRIVNEYDPIPKVPKIGYKHVSPPYSILYNKYKKYKFYNICNKNLFLDVECHYLDFYLKETNFIKLCELLNGDTITDFAGV